MVPEYLVFDELIFNSEIEMEKITLRLSTDEDKAYAVALDYALNGSEHVLLKREEKITKAISKSNCFIVLRDSLSVGFVLFDYRFFDQGWIELLIIEKNERGKGIGKRTLELLCEHSKTNKVFTSTNKSNLQMQKALVNAGFIFAGRLEGLDEGDPELFYYNVKVSNLNS